MAGQVFNMLNGTKLLVNFRSLVHLNHFVPSLNMGTDAKSIQEVLSEKPKRPKTAYLQFITEQRPLLAKSDPKIKSVDAIRTLSEKWNALSASSKVKYQELAAKEKEKYDDEILKFEENLTPEQVELIDKVSEDQRKDRLKRRLKKESSALGKPKYPLPAFAQFYQENTIKGVPVTQAMVQIKEKWNQLSDVEKEKYTIAFKRNQETYLQDLEKWEQKMLADGKKHLVRPATLAGNWEVKSKKSTTKKTLSNKLKNE